MKKILFTIWGLCWIGATLLKAQDVDSVRIMHYNILKYGYEWSCMSQTTKNNYLRTIFTAYKPDLLTVNEIEPKEATINGLRTNTLGYNTSMTAAPYSNSNGSDIVNCLYYNATKFGYLGLKAIKGNVRDIDVHRLYHKAATTKGDTLDFYFFVAHFKAGTDFPEARAETAKDIANWLTVNRKIERYLLSGDLNLYSSNEQAWITLTGGTSPRFVDPANAATGWRGQAFAGIHTQSPNDNTNNCAATGGMDDRFDFILVSPVLSVGTQKIKPLGYRAFGNDGQSYNEALDCSKTKSVSSAVCTALRKVSDHLPVTMELSFPKTAEGTAEQLPFKATLWGNPASEKTKVLLETAESGNYTWELTNILGQRPAWGIESISAPGSSFEIILPAMASGSYFVTVRNREDKAIMLKLLCKGE